MCCCKAHEREDEKLYMAVLGRLVTVELPLTDDTGNVLAMVLLLRRVASTSSTYNGLGEVSDALSQWC